MKSIRIQCPAVDEDKEKRIADLKENIRAWIFSEPLTDLIKAFGGTLPEKCDWYGYIAGINDFAQIWDYRNKTNKKNERWMVEDDQMVLNNSDIIMESARQLCMLGVDEPIDDPDYVLPLGGARMTNYERPLFAKEILDKRACKPTQIVALTGKRPINEIEREYLMKYAPDAMTEYDAMCGGMEKVFGLKDSNYLETSYHTQNVNLQWAVREYDSRYNDHCITVLAAPSTEPQRRANSYDTFEFFLDKFNIKAGDSILLVTSGIYVPFQLTRFLPIAIEKNIFVDCVGLSNAQTGVAFSKASNYCQEIKATINAIKALADMYWKS